jgi:catechol 2,3-dioxygenase-like lactoylglutathione lyase family enzyme
MDHVGVVVDDLSAAVAVFVELGLEAQDGGPASISGEWVDRVVGLDGFRVDIIFVSTPDGHGRLELTKFHTPRAVSSESMTPNTIGLRRLMFAVDDIDDVVSRLRALGYDVIGEVARYKHDTKTSTASAT